MTNEIPWPVKPENLPRDEFGQIMVGQYFIAECGEGWGYFDNSGSLLGSFDTKYEAINEGALRDDYRGINV